MLNSRPGRFTTGSTMRHVAVMTATGSIGLFFMFLIDFVTLFYVSLLGEDVLTAGVGYAWTVQFFTVSVGIGFSIAALALVSQAIGAGELERARRRATSAMLIAVSLLTVAVLLVIAARREILGLIGAVGDSGGVAAEFLLIALPSLPFIGLSMISSSVLRAEGDARRAMLVTVVAGLAAMVLDPLLIFGLDLGVDGAAYAMVMSRMISSGFGLWMCARKGLCARPSIADARAFMRPFFGIAAPAVTTQLSTPFGNILLTWWISGHGDSAVAGWAVASRLTVLAFGGIFALSGAIGGIIGQNYGAKLGDRVARTYRDSLIFASGYVASVWILLASLAPLIARAFGVDDAGADVILAFCYVGAGGFMFNGALFVANAAFNNLNRPLFSTAFNWMRDGAVTPLALLLVPVAWGAPGVVYAQASAGVLIGTLAVWAGWRLSHNMIFEGAVQTAPWSPKPMAAMTGRSAAAVMLAEETDELPGRERLAPDRGTD
ncbi:MATE family efflux transporter [Pikeienuella sp. HZG-20]|uniref:MATE family efflux transporter n=1 Tax=Paludibacillus litoralis TaxID=3133267 RepID=UPI0030EE782F